MAGHNVYEDIQALLTGSLLAAVGVVIFKAGGLLAGGTVGLSLLASYLSGADLGLMLVVVNLPFYLFAVFRLGREFTTKTVLAAAVTALIVHALPRGFELAHVSPLVAAVVGGTLTGVGLLVLFRHTASLGGLNVVVLYAQQRWRLSPGLLQLVLDATILVGGCAALGDFGRLPASLVAVVFVNGVLAFNHRPGRYSPTV
ncbi:MAG: YitT family protein [Burkholderiales bacterium]|nr:YitT family protein [Burkholderiales bacterium]